MAVVRHADYSFARTQYPEIDKLTAADWIDFFKERPDVFTKLLGEIYIITKTQELSQKKSGRRTRYINGNLDELWGMIAPRYSTATFADSVREIMGTQSLRAFAAKIPMHHHSLARLMRGERQIVNPNDPISSMHLLERIAKAGNVHPAFFAEWRTLYVTNAISSVLQDNPHMSIAIVGQLAGERAS